jgi:hypothetical protein
MDTYAADRGRGLGTVREAVSLLVLSQCLTVAPLAIPFAQR